MNRPRLLLIGAGGHAHACIDVLERHGEYDIAGLIGLPEELRTVHFCYSVIGTDDDLPALADTYRHALIGAGQIRSPELRMRLYRRAVDLGFEMPVIVAPTAHVSAHAVIGAGTIVMHGAIVNAGARIGSNCIVNTRAVVEHDVSVDDHCHIATGAILNGHVRVGAGSFVGSGSVVREGVAIGSRCLVGMASCVRHDQSDHARCVGGK